MPDGLPSVRLNAITNPSGGVDDGGLRAISGAYGDLTRAALNIGQAVRNNEVKDGSKEALEAFNKAAAETPGGERVSVPERKGGLLDVLGVRAEAYENAIGLLTVQRAERDARTELAQLSAANFGNPAAFEKAAREWAAGYLENAPGEVAPQIQLALDDRVAEFHSRAIIDRQQLDLQEARQSTDAELQSLEDDLTKLADTDGIAAFRSPEYLEKQNKIVDLLEAKAANPAFVYSDEQRNLDLDRFTKGVVLRAASATLTDEIKETLDFGGVGAAKTALSNLMENEFFASLDRADQKKLRLAGERAIDEREREIKAAVAEQKRARAEYQAEQYGGLLASVIKGEAGLADVEKAREEGKLSMGQYASLLDRTVKEDKEAVKLDAARDLVGGDAPLNPADEKHRDAVDLVFKDQGGAQLLRENPQAGVENALSFAATKGVLPKSAVTTLRGLIANGSAEQQQTALDSVTRLLEQAPAAARSAFQDQEIAEAVYYSDLVATGAPPEFALTSIMKAREAKFDGAAKVRRAAAAKLAAEEISREDVFKAIGVDRGTPETRVFGGGAAVDGAEARYRQLFTEHYAAHGDADRAKKQAAAVVGKHFGETRVTGQKRVMMHPPEQYYAVPGSDQKWMGAQLEREVAALVGEPVPMKDIQLISDRTTAAEAQGGFSPTYKVVRKRADGALETLDGRFAFDPSKEQFSIDYENFRKVKLAEEARPGEVAAAERRQFVADRLPGAN